MAQRIDVAIVFRDMLGVADATNYMIANGVPDHVMERVLAGLAVTRIGGVDMVEYADIGTDAERRAFAAIRFDTPQLA